jgi:hypothetical protein
MIIPTSVDCFINVREVYHSQIEIALPEKPETAS